MKNKVDLADVVQSIIDTVIDNPDSGPRQVAVEEIVRHILAEAYEAGYNNALSDTGWDGGVS